MIVYAAPIYYFGVTAQLAAAIQRVYCIGKPEAKKAALLISSGSPGTARAAVTMYKDMLAYCKMEDCGIFTLAGDENKDPDKLSEIHDFAKSL